MIILRRLFLADSMQKKRTDFISIIDAQVASQESLRSQRLLCVVKVTTSFVTPRADRPHKAPFRSDKIIFTHIAPHTGI